MALTFALLIQTDAAAQYVVTPVMSGLDNPRGLAFGPDGGLYVAEAGRGGTIPTSIVVEGQPRFFGTTSGTQPTLGRSASARADRFAVARNLQRGQQPAA